MREVAGLKGIAGFSYLASLPEGDGDIVSMVVKDDVLYIASANHIYKLADERRLEKLEGQT